MVTHNILLQKKLKWDRFLRLIENNLNDRNQQVYIDGVSQGNVFGPLLFTIYVNGLLTMNIKGAITSFAEDTAIFYKLAT